MIDPLCQWLNRPLRDGDRTRLFLAAVATILAGAGVLVPRRPPRTAAASLAPATRRAHRALAGRRGDRRPGPDPQRTTVTGRFNAGIPRRRRGGEANGAPIPRRLPALHLRPPSRSRHPRGYSAVAPAPGDRAATGAASGTAPPPARAAGAGRGREPHARRRHRARRRRRAPLHRRARAAPPALGLDRHERRGLTRCSRPPSPQPQFAAGT